ncbi:MAG: HD domain-containing protein, partial [bacterium]
MFKFEYLVSILVGILLNYIFRKFQSLSISIYGRKIYKEDYFIVPSDSLFFLFAFIFNSDLLNVLFVFLGFIGSSVVRKYFLGFRSISIPKVFISSLSFFIPFLALCMILKFFVKSYFDFQFYLFGFVVYLFLNKFLSLYILSKIGRGMSFSFRQVFRVGFAESFLFSQFVITYIGFIFLSQSNFINFVFLAISQLIFIKMIYFANNLLDSYQDLVDTLLRLLQEYDFDTYEHSERVAVIAQIIAKSMGLNKEQVDSIVLAARLHD